MLGLLVSVVCPLQRGDAGHSRARVPGAYNPAAGTATWVDVSHDLGDIPVTDVVRDDVTGNLSASTDFVVSRLLAGTTGWVAAAPGMPNAEVAGVTIAPCARKRYAATHGLSVCVLNLPSVARGEAAGRVPRHFRVVRRLLLQRDFLHAPVRHLANQQLVFVAAVDRVREPELLGSLPAAPNLPTTLPSSCTL